MTKIVFTWGMVSGVIVASFIAMMPFCMDGQMDFSDSMIVGYTIMFLAFLMVFFGVRSYRDTVGGGVITFRRAFKVGILITLVSCAIYVTTWEIVQHAFMPDFADKYSAKMIEKKREKGATDAEIAAERKEMADFKRMYANPFFNVGMTFIEVFPVGLIMTLVSAGILKRKTLGMPLPA